MTNADTWGPPATAADLRADLQRLRELMDADTPHREPWIFPPLVREPVTESKVMDDPRFLAWHGEYHPRQTPDERACARVIRRAMVRQAKSRRRRTLWFWRYGTENARAVRKIRAKRRFQC